MISSCRSPIFDGDGLSREGSCMLKTTNVSWCTVVYHMVIVLYMSMGSHSTRAKSINWGGYFVFVCSSVLWIDLKNQTGLFQIHLSHIRPLCSHVLTCQALCVDDVDVTPTLNMHRDMYSKPKRITDTRDSSLMADSASVPSGCWGSPQTSCFHRIEVTRNWNAVTAGYITWFCDKKYNSVYVSSMRFVFSAVLSVAEKTHT